MRMYLSATYKGYWIYAVFISDRFLLWPDYYIIATGRLGPDDTAHGFVKFSDMVDAIAHIDSLPQQ